MKTETLIKSIFPVAGSVDLRGFPLGSKKEDIQQKEGEPYDKTSFPGRETWLYSINYEDNIIIELSYIFGKKAVSTALDVYLNFPGSDYTAKEVEKIRK